MRSAVLAVVAGMLAIAPAFSAPPPGSDPNSPTAQWFRGLKQPGSGIGCCDQSDCRPTTARRVGVSWQAQTPAGEWVDVPPEKVLADEAHPGGAAVLCYLPMLGVLCFVPPMAGG